MHFRRSAFILAPPVGLEPTTLRLTAACSTDWAIEEYLCRHYLFSRAASSQVSSAQMSLTTVFGMGTGGPSSQSTPTHETLYLVNARDILSLWFTKCKCFFNIFLSFCKIHKTYYIIAVFTVKIHNKTKGMTGFVIPFIIKMPLKHQLQRIHNPD